METSQNTSIEFYQNLGKLFYAIAAADKVVRKSEYDSLRKHVQAKWLQVDDIEDEFGVDTAFQIEVVFDWMNYETVNAESCFTEFELFYKEHPSLYSKKIKQLIWDTAISIAEAFSGKNKSELILLGRLSLIFEN